MAEMYASRGVGGAGLGLGIAGTALGVLNGGLGNVLGGILAPKQTEHSGCKDGCSDAALMAAMSMMTNSMIASAPRSCGCNEDHLVNRYEAAQQAEIERLRSENDLLRSNTYTDQKILATYQYIDGQLTGIRNELCAQAVRNQRTEDSFALAHADLMAVKNDLQAQIAMEAERRCCADNSIVTYSNATFYPKLVADVTAGTTTTAQTLYNPIPKCGCCGNG